MLKYMSYHYIPESGSVVITKHWFKKGRIVIRSSEYKSDSAKALTKYIEFCKLCKEQKEKEDEKPPELRRSQTLLSINSNFIIL